MQRHSSWGAHGEPGPSELANLRAQLQQAQEELLAAKLSMENWQQTAQQAIERAEAAEGDAATQRALAEERGSALVLASANVRQDAWDKMSIAAKVRIIEALPDKAQARRGEGE